MLPLLALPDTVYVSPSGDDRAAGTSEAPLRSLRTAIERVHGGRIVLKPGTYTIDSTIVIGPDDDGLAIVAEKPGTARLLGGRVLRRWTTPTAAERARLAPSAVAHVRVYDLAKDEPIADLGEMVPTGFGDPRERAGLELFFSGRTMPLARWPNSGWLRTGPGTRGPSIAYPNSRARAWAGERDVWAMGYWGVEWAEAYDRVTGLTGQGFRLKQLPRYPAVPNRRFVFLNILRELDSPGEWCLDRTERKLYFWPPAEAGETVASTLDEAMFRLRNAAHVQLKGLQLQAGRAEAVRIEGGFGNTVEDCLIRDFGTDGVVVSGATDSGVEGSDLTELGSRGVVLSGGDRKTLTQARLFATNDHIWNYARWNRAYEPAVALDGVGNRATQNLITDAPHTAILVNGNDQLLEGNDVRRVCTETADAGAFYMGRNPTMRGTVIRGNRFRDLRARVGTGGATGDVMAVYLDDAWSGTTIQGNVFEGPGVGVMIGGGQDDVVLRNVFVNEHPAVHVDARGRGWAKGSILNPQGWNFGGKVDEVDATHGVYAARYPRLASVLGRGFGVPSGTRIVGNVATGSGWLRLQDGLTMRDVGAADNAQLSTGTLSDALKLLPLDLSKIGLTTRTGRPYDLATHS